MLDIKFFVMSSGEIKGFEISGHAGYDDYGKDIVCAGVSSACYMVVNTITDILKLNIDLNIDENDGYMYVCVRDEIIPECKLLFKGLKLHLLTMEDVYSKNLKVSYEEVH